jgi:hypothetical protein
MVSAAVTCAERDGMVLCHDSQHLNTRFARSLAEEFWNRLPPEVQASLGP